MENQKNNKKQPIELIKKLIVLITAIFLILAALEIVIRFFTKPVYSILRTDKEVGTIHQKNFRGNLWNNESQKENYIITNSLGYIGKEIKKEKDKNTIRIAMLGDSQTEGLQVDYYKNFSALLENSLNISNLARERFEILNYGVGGTGTFLQYQTYKKNIAPYKPDAVFLIFALNDYVDNLVKINFDLENYKDEKSRNIFLKSFLLKFQLPKYVFSKMQNNILFLEILNKFGLYELNDNLREELRGRGSELEKKQEFYEYTFSIISKFDKLVRNNDSKFFVIIMPNEPSVKTPSLWKGNEKITKLIEFLEKERIQYFNPSEFLALSEAEQGKCLSYGCVGHFNEFGHETYAKALYIFIKEQYLYAYR